ncbi:hypothetical protein [Croceibacterium mercuriale]|uniref:hypothetical protein n=1 Tax=Croceibacterium mercuriale TaxID=1572751 RepID=UPI001F181592|nr:hypothetical protein [Croceibacterium mercuriale]
MPAPPHLSTKIQTILHLIFATPVLYLLVRTLWPLSLPLPVKGAVAVLLLVASQYHLWSRLSSGSVFAPEFPRAVIILFNWALGAILLLAVVQILLDPGALVAAAVRWHSVTIPDGLRYAAAGLATIIASIGVANATRVPPLKDVRSLSAGCRRNSTANACCN